MIFIYYIYKQYYSPTYQVTLPNQLLWRSCLNMCQITTVFGTCTAIAACVTVHVICQKCFEINTPTCPFWLSMQLYYTWTINTHGFPGDNVVNQDQGVSSYIITFTCGFLIQHGSVSATTSWMSKWPNWWWLNSCKWLLWYIYHPQIPTIQRDIVYTLLTSPKMLTRFVSETT